MEPLKPQIVRDLLARPQVDPKDIEEYERLLSERFATDPDLPKAPHLMAAIKTREDRLQELYKKLFPGGAGQP